MIATEETSVSCSWWSWWSWASWSCSWLCEWSSWLWLVCSWLWSWSCLWGDEFACSSFPSCRQSLLKYWDVHLPSRLVMMTEIMGFSYAKWVRTSTAPIKSDDSELQVDLWIVTGSAYIVSCLCVPFIHTLGMGLICLDWNPLEPLAADDIANNIVAQA